LEIQEVLVQRFGTAIDGCHLLSVTSIRCKIDLYAVFLWCNIYLSEYFICHTITT
jgi:hypothetical protein